MGKEGKQIAGGRSVAEAYQPVKIAPHWLDTAWVGGDISQPVKGQNAGCRPGGIRITKVGIFCEHQLPRPWTETSEYDLLQQSLDQDALADQLGYKYVWEVEHHVLEEYSHSSAPEVVLAAASPRTKNIHLGHGIIRLITNQPHRGAERVATLDLISGGRVEFGMDEGAGPAALHPFGTRVRDKRGRWEGAVKAIIPMFTKTSYALGGTDCALPMLWAAKHKVEADVFMVYTDNETWFGKVDPAQALAEYRLKMGIPAKPIVVGMCANRFTISDPQDLGMLDVVGFDTSVPQAMREFVLA